MQIVSTIFSFIVCTIISQNQITELTTYLHADESIRSKRFNFALIPYVVSPIALDDNICGKVAKFCFLFFLLIYYYKEVQPVSGNFTRYFIFIMSKSMCTIGKFIPFFLTVQQPHSLKLFWLYISALVNTN